MKKAIALMLAILGFVFLIGGLYQIYLRYRPNSLSLDNLPREYNTQAANSPAPTRIIINTIKVDLPLISVKLDKNNWPTSNYGVAYLENYTSPGEKGNAILYGHNWPNLLGNLPRTKVGDLITIIYANGEAKIFKVDATQSVSPANTKLLASSDLPKLTLYTCTGFLDTQRFVVSAAYQGSVLAYK